MKEATLISAKLVGLRLRILLPFLLFTAGLSAAIVVAGVPEEIVVPLAFWWTLTATPLLLWDQKKRIKKKILANFRHSDATLRSMVFLAVAVGIADEIDRLDLSSSPVTDAGLSHLRRLSSLQVLCLPNTKVTDAGLRHISQLESLVSLDLFNTSIGNSGLHYLANLESLVQLDLTRTRVTEEGILEFDRQRSIDKVLCLWPAPAANGAKFRILGNPHYGQSLSEGAS